jgi:hypothetical protein
MPRRCPWLFYISIAAGSWRPAATSYQTLPLLVPLCLVFTVASDQKRPAILSLAYIRTVPLDPMAAVCCHPRGLAWENWRRAGVVRSRLRRALAFSLFVWRAAPTSDLTTCGLLSEGWRRRREKSWRARVGITCDSYVFHRIT